MPRQVTVVTPENVKINYELAGFASRAGAAIIDTAIQLALCSIVFGARFYLEKLHQWPGMNWGYALLGIILFAIYYGYFLYFETVWNGQTPGKRICMLRTIKDGGLPLDLQCSAVRNFVRVVDFIPGIVPYLIGMLSVICSSKNKRLGDYAAGTLVVKERTEWNGDLKNAGKISDSLPDVVGYVKNIELVSPDEFEVVKRFVERMPELQSDIREQLAEKIAISMMERLGIENSGQISYSDFLSEIYKQCIEERGMQ